jgi:phage/plasmid-like protein (TIGR03299 family)
MAHELEIVDGQAKMFSGEGLTPWHGMGNVIEGLATAEEALELSGLDWDVELRPTAFMGADGQWKAHGDRFSAVRLSDEKYLGNDLSKGYHIYQNRESFDFLNAITDTGSGEAAFSTAGSLFGGSRTFITLKLNDAFTVGDQDAHDLYLMCTNSHDGSAAFTVSITPIRAVCNNTVTLGLREAKTKWTVKHKKALKDRVQDARHILELGFKYEDAFEKEVAKLMEIEVTKDKFFGIVDKIVPASKRQHDLTVDEIMAVWENEPTVKMGGGEGNAWGAFNALTYYTDHKEYRTTESRFNSIIGTGTQQGFAEALRPKMHKALLALA